MAYRLEFHLSIERDDVTSPDAGAALDTVVTAAVGMLETLSVELQTSANDTVSGDTVRSEAARLQAELDKVNAGNTPVDPPVDPTSPAQPVDPTPTPEFSDSPTSDRAL